MFATRPFLIKILGIAWLFPENTCGKIMENFGKRGVFVELWTKEHAYSLLPAILVMVLLGWLLRRWLGGKDLKVRLIPLQIIACLLLALEVGKQVISLLRGYDLYHLPFHFCSLYIFMVPLMAFCKEKHRPVVFRIVPALGISLFLLMLLYPNLIYGPWDVRNFFTEYMSFHTVAFHNLVMLATVLILALDLRAMPDKADPKPVLWFTVGFCAVSATMAQLLKTNFANFYQCNIPPLEAVRAHLQGILGYPVTQVLYVLAVSVLTVLFVLMSYGLYRVLCGKLNRVPVKQ
jgi:hypothetical protein